MEIKLADARLDDAGVLRRLPALLVLAKGPSTSSVPALETPWLDEMDDFASKYLRKRFCTSCGAPMRALVEEWIEWRANGVLQAASYLQGMEWPLMIARVAGGRFVDDRLRADLSHHYLHLEGVERGPSGPIDLVDLPGTLSKLKGSRIDETEAALIYAIYNSLSDTDASDERFRLFAGFLFATDATEKSALWRNLIDPIKEHLGEFGSDRFYLLLLDRLGRHLQLNGYTKAADVVWSDLLNELYPTDMPADRQAFYERQRIDLVAITSAAHARAGARDALAGHFAAADAHLSAARTLVIRRLSTEWQVGGDRAAFILREVQPSLRLIAQARARIAADSAAFRAVPKLADRVFEDLQLAMIEDTALSVLLSQKRRLMSDPTLVAAVGRRDREQDALDVLDAYETSVGVMDADWLADARQSHEAARGKEVKAIAALLPGPEDLAAIEPIRLDEATELLDARYRLILLHSGSDAVFGMEVVRNGPPRMWISEVATDDLAGRIADLRRGTLIEDGALPVYPVDEAYNLAVDLLGKEVLDEDGSVTGPRRLLFAVDGALRSLPFAILPSRPPSVVPRFPDEYRDAGIEWLGARDAIIHLPTLRSFATTKAGLLASAAPERFLGIGDPALASATVPSVDEEMKMAQAFALRGRGASRRSRRFLASRDHRRNSPRCPVRSAQGPIPCCWETRRRNPMSGRSISAAIAFSPSQRTLSLPANLWVIPSRA